MNRKGGQYQWLWQGRLVADIKNEVLLGSVESPSTAQSCTQLTPAKEVAYNLVEQRASLQAWPRLPGLFSLRESEGLEGIKYSLILKSDTRFLSHDT